MRMTVEPDGTRLDRISAHFQRAVDAGRLPGWSARVDVAGETVFRDHGGVLDLEQRVPVAPDSIFRAFSMTKPITSVAAMMLYEQGRFDLRTPVAEFIPEFADTMVCATPDADPDQLEPQREPLSIWHLLTHTSGLTYSWLGDNRVGAQYNRAQIGFPGGTADLAETARQIAGIPLLFQPGRYWNYSMSTDVLGRVVEVASGQSLDAYLQSNILGPLGMSDTAFGVPEDKGERVAVFYDQAAPDAAFTPNPVYTNRDLSQPAFLSGGGGLFTTLDDYSRFAAMLAAGGSLDGEVIIGRDTLDYMASNHLPPGEDLDTFARTPLEGNLAGLGFGLGFAVVIDAPARRILTRPGNYYWNGAGGSTFWIDAERELSVVFMMSVRSGTNYQWESDLRKLVYQAYVA
jgi:CubicO group peptidase (beta-lactamase class C family)